MHASALFLGTIPATTVMATFIACGFDTEQRDATRLEEAGGPCRVGNAVAAVL